MSKIQILAVILFLGVGAGAVYLNSKNQPSSMGHSSALPDLTSMEDGDPIIEVKLPTSLTNQGELGKRAFDAVCAACHGENGVGTFGIAPPLVYLIYESSHHGDASFLNAALNGVTSHHWPFGDMPPQQGLTKGDIANIVAYVRELQRANGIN